MNIFAWPLGTLEIINKLEELDPKNDKDIYNKKVRQFARRGLIYEKHGDDKDEYECYCPFCRAQKKKTYHFKQRCCYSHSLTCYGCSEFKRKLNKLNDELFTKIAELCSISNIFLNSLCSKKFNEILHFTNPLFRSIKRKTLREKIFEVALTYLNDINSKCHDEFCSILIDGVKRNNKNFYGFVIHTKTRLFYFKIEKVTYASSSNIVKITQDIIDFINLNTNLEIISICTDHAANLLKAFNPFDQKSSQYLNSQFFEWVGCFSHLFNLGICDLFSLEEFCNFYMYLDDILNICKKLDFSKKVPSFSKTRWESYSKCLNFLNEKKSQIISYFDEKIQNLDAESEKYNYYIEILNSNDFKELTQLFNYISQISSEIGKDNYLICYVYSKIIKFKKFISNLTSVSVRGFGFTIVDRIYTSDEIQIAITAYFLTIEGRDYFLNQDDQNQQKIYFDIINQYIFHYNKMKFQFDENILEKQIKLYLDYQIEEKDSFLFWNDHRGDNNFDFLSEIAIRIINMACSELPVERLFSHLKYLYGSKDYNKSEDLLNAQLAIRMESIYLGED